MRGRKNVTCVLSLVLLATLAALLIEVDKAFARKLSYVTNFRNPNLNKLWLYSKFENVELVVKCYRCFSHKRAEKCDDENRGTLQTCVHNDDMCYKTVTKKRLENAKDGDPQVGESREKGCAPFIRKNHTLGCNFLTVYTDYCYCNTDRCNTHEYEPAQWILFVNKLEMK